MNERDFPHLVELEWPELAHKLPPSRKANHRLGLGRFSDNGDFMQADDQAASVQLNPPAGFRPQVSAMVEYAFP